MMECAKKRDAPKGLDLVPARGGSSKLRGHSHYVLAVDGAQPPSFPRDPILLCQVPQVVNLSNGLGSRPRSKGKDGGALPDSRGPLAIR